MEIERARPCRPRVLIRDLAGDDHSPPFRDSGEVRFRAEARPRLVRLRRASGASKRQIRSTREIAYPSLSASVIQLAKLGLPCLEWLHLQLRIWKENEV